MTLTGTVLNGVVVFDVGPPLPEGSKVSMVVQAPATQEDDTTGPGTLAPLLKFAGLATDLPADFAAQHNHYIHGAPKR